MRAHPVTQSVHHHSEPSRSSETIGNRSLFAIPERVKQIPRRPKSCNFSLPRGDFREKAQVQWVAQESQLPFVQIVRIKPKTSYYLLYHAQLKSSNCHHIGGFCAFGQSPSCGVF